MDLKKLRYFQLQKQNLLLKAKSSNYLKVLEYNLGLHSTDYLTPYLSLWARVENFEPENLFSDLNNKKAVRMRAFRGTVFVINTTNLPLIIRAAKHYHSSRIKEVIRFIEKNDVVYDEDENNLISILKGNRQLTINEIKKETDGKIKKDIITLLIRSMEFKNIVIRTTQRYISDTVIKYSLTKEWIPEIIKNNMSPDLALEELTFKYIKQFAPVTIDDLCWWFPITKTLARKVLEQLKGKLTNFKFNNTEYFMEQDDYEQLLNFKTPDKNSPQIDFLPYEDHFTKSYIIRDWFLPAESIPFVTREGRMYMGQIFPSIWLNGEIIGGWELKWIDKQKSTAQINITGINESKINSSIKSKIEQHKNKLQNFVNTKIVPLMKK